MTLELYFSEREEQFDSGAPRATQVLRAVLTAISTPDVFVSVAPLSIAVFATGKGSNGSAGNHSDFVQIFALPVQVDPATLEGRFDGNDLVLELRTRFCQLAASPE